MIPFEHLPPPTGYQYVDQLSGQSANPELMQDGTPNTAMWRSPLAAYTIRHLAAGDYHATITTYHGHTRNDPEWPGNQVFIHPNPALITAWLHDTLPTTEPWIPSLLEWIETTEPALSAVAAPVPYGQPWPPAPNGPYHFTHATVTTFIPTTRRYQITPHPDTPDGQQPTWLYATSLDTPPRHIVFAHSPDGYRHLATELTSPTKDPTPMFDPTDPAHLTTYLAAWTGCPELTVHPDPDQPGHYQATLPGHPAPLSTGPMSRIVADLTSDHDLTAQLPIPVRTPQPDDNPLTQYLANPPAVTNPAVAPHDRHTVADAIDAALTEAWPDPVRPPGARVHIDTQPGVWPGLGWVARIYVDVLDATIFAPTLHIPHPAVVPYQHDQMIRTPMTRFAHTLPTLDTTL